MVGAFPGAGASKCEYHAGQLAGSLPTKVQLAAGDRKAIPAGARERQEKKADNA
jgi:hypothetical protein